MHKQESRAMEFNADKDHSYFRHFSEQLRVETSAFSSLFIEHSIWSDPILPKLAFTNSTLNRIKNDSDGGFSTKSIGFKNYYSPAPNSKKNRFFDNAKKKNVNSCTINESHKNSNNVNGKEGENRFKTLPASEALPRNETIGGYIFVCNNETMQENLERRLFGLPSRYRDSVRAITPGLPLFLYNYSAHQLYGVFEAASFGGTNIDPSAWEDKNKPGESRFPAQVRVVARKLCEPLEEDSFRPFLHHYDGPKFRLELCIPKALALLDIFEDVQRMD